MKTVSVKEARQNFARLIEAARKGAAVTITRRGREVARITGIGGRQTGRLPDLTAFRASLKGGRKGRTTTIENLRRGERY